MGKINTDSPTSNQKPNSSAGSTDPTTRNMGIHFAETAWRVAVPFIVFSLAGVWADDRFDTKPIFTIIGVLVALASVSVVVYKYVNKYFPSTFNRGDNDS